MCLNSNLLSIQHGPSNKIGLPQKERSEQIWLTVRTSGACKSYHKIMMAQGALC